MLELHNFQLTQFYGVEAVKFEDISFCNQWREVLAPLVIDVTKVLHDYRKEGKAVMFEGAQGSLQTSTTVLIRMLPAQIQLLVV